MKSFLAVLALAVIAALVVLSQRTSEQAPLPTDLSPPAAEKQENPISMVDSPVQVRTQVESATPTASEEEAVAEPAADTSRIPFNDLPLGVRGLVERAAKQYGFRIDDIKQKGFDVLAAEDFSKIVDEMRRQYDIAAKIVRDEEESIKQLALQQGRFVSFDSDEAFMAELDKDDGLYRLADEGEREGPGGVPEYFRRIVAVKVGDYPALQDALGYVEGFEQWRESLKGDAMALLAR